MKSGNDFVQSRFIYTNRHIDDVFDFSAVECDENCTEKIDETKLEDVTIPENAEVSNPDEIFTEDFELPFKVSDFMDDKDDQEVKENDHISDLGIGYYAAVRPLKDIMAQYESLSEDIKKYENDEKTYKEKLGDDANFYVANADQASLLFGQLIALYDKNKDSSSSDNILSFNDAYKLYNVIDFLIKINKSNQYSNMGYDLEKLRDKVLFSSYDMTNYWYCVTEIEDLYHRRSKVLDQVTFKVLYDGEHFHDCCHSSAGHLFMRFDDELKCVWCNASTKDFNLTKEELDFLTECAKQKCMLLSDATLDDLPFIKLFKENREKIIEESRPDDSFYDNIEERLYEDEEFTAEYMYFESLVEDSSSELMRALGYAHVIDKNIKDDDYPYNPVYLSEDVSKELLENIDNDLRNLEHVRNLFNNQSKKLAVEIIKTRKFEILILSGKHIPTMYNSLDNESDKICLIKAYYNLSKKNYRVSSEYFEESRFNYIAGRYVCLTADKEINTRIHEMKVNR